MSNITVINHREMYAIRSLCVTNISVSQKLRLSDSGSGLVV